MPPIKRTGTSSGGRKGRPGTSMSKKSGGSKKPASKIKNC